MSKSEKSALTILTPLHSLDGGGVERVADRMDAEWRAAGAESRVLLGRVSPEAGGTGRSLRAWAADWKRHCETLYMIAILPRAILRRRPDVLFCAGNTYAVVAAAMKLLLGKRCPPIVLKVSNDLHRPDLPGLVRWFYRRWLHLQGRMFDRFVGLAEPMRDEIERMMKVDPDRVAIIPDPVLSDAELDDLGRLPRPLPRAGRRFVAVGRLAPQKNYPLLIRAFARAARPADSLTIFGDGPQRARLERLAAGLGLAGRVTLPGFAPCHRAKFEDADAMVISSDYEGVPAVLVEALAAGVPIVSTDCCVSMRAILGDGRRGVLVPACDVAALARAMDEIGSRAFHAGEARLFAAQFSLEAGAARYLQLFASLAHGAERHADAAFTLEPAPATELV